MPVRTLPEMITEIRLCIDDKDGNSFTAEELLVFLNRALSYYDSELAVHAAQLFMTNKDITHDGTELQRILPYLPRIVSVERTSNSPRNEIHPMWMGFRDRFKFLGTSILDQNLVDSTYNRYYVQNNQIGSLPTVASGTDRIWVALSSPPLHYGEVSTYTAGTRALVLQTLAPSTDSEHLGAMVLMNDAYNEIPIIFHDEREVNIISDWAQSTKTATLAVAAETAPDANDNYSILPRIHPEHQGVLIYHAAKLARASHDEDATEMHELESEVRRTMYAYLASAQEQQEEYVNMIQEWNL